MGSLRPLYPFGQALAGVVITANAWAWMPIPVALAIGGIGAISVLKAVDLDKRELECACIGGSSNVPLGFVSLTEPLFWSAWRFSLCNPASVVDFQVEAASKISMPDA